MAKAASILHVDMDSFFVSVELRSRPEFIGQPVVVAGHGARSVVSSASYEARRFGVHSAMPLARAKQRCPHLIVIEPNFPEYVDASRQVMSIFREFTPLVEPLSIDEAFLDVTGAGRLFGTPLEIAQQLRTRTSSEAGLVASVGIASVKFVAKLASGRAKPDGIFIVEPDETEAFLRALPIQEMWGVGGVTAQKLLGRGIRTVGDLAVEPIEHLQRIVGTAAAQRLNELARGIDERPVEPDREVKSVGAEETFETDLIDRRALERELLSLSVRVSERLRDKMLEAHTVTVKLRWHDFDTITRSKTLHDPTQATKRIHEVAKELFTTAWNGTTPIRLVGVRAENLVHEGAESGLLWDDNESWRVLDSASDSIRKRFGAEAVRPATLIRKSDDPRGEP